MSLSRNQMRPPQLIPLVCFWACTSPDKPEAPQSSEEAATDTAPPDDDASPQPDDTHTSHDSGDDTGEGEDEDTGDSEETTDPTLSDHEYDGWVDRELPDLALLELDLQELLDNLYRYNGHNYIDAYSFMIDEWGGDCPTPIDYGYLIRHPAPSGGCTTDSGVLLTGTLDVYPSTGNPRASLRGQMFAFFPDGTQAYMGGNGITHTYNDGATGDRRTWNSTVSGNYYHTQTTDYPWMASSHTASFQMSHAEYHTGYQYFSIKGDLEAAHGAITALQTDLLYWSTGNLCPTELANNVWVRLEDGQWVEIRFDLTSNDWGGSQELTGTCDGCAMAILDGTELGEVCLDIAPLMWDEGSSPWSH